MASFSDNYAEWRRNWKLHLKEVSLHQHRGKDTFQSWKFYFATFEMLINVDKTKSIFVLLKFKWNKIDGINQGSSNVAESFSTEVKHSFLMMTFCSRAISLRCFVGFVIARLAVEYVSLQTEAKSEDSILNWKPWAGKMTGQLVFQNTVVLEHYWSNLRWHSLRRGKKGRNMG